MLTLEQIIRWTEEIVFYAIKTIFRHKNGISLWEHDFSNFVYFWNFLACCCFHYLWGVKFSDRWTSWAEMNCSHLTSTAWLSLFHFWHSSSLWWCIVLCNSNTFYLCFRIRKTAVILFICPLTLLLPYLSCRLLF